MNIKEHIEAGHYPTDDKGRALVPVGCDKVATICATDAPGEKPILGFIRSDSKQYACGSNAWDERGDNCPSQPRACWVDLLPPPPRKVPLYARVECTTRNGNRDWLLRIFGAQRGPIPFKEGLTFTLTGEYEEPWS